MLIDAKFMLRSCWRHNCICKESDMSNFGGFIEGPIIGVEPPSDGAGFLGPGSQARQDYVFRTYSGLGNNLVNPHWGSANTPQLAKASLQFDPATQLARPNGPNARNVSNVLCKGAAVPNSAGLSNMFWAFMQFIDHTIDLTPTQSGDGAEKLYITVPSNDDYYVAGRVITMTRSKYVLQNGVRRALNDIGSFLDGTNLYGNSDQRCRQLRALDGTGKMLVSMANNGEVLLPRNTVSLDMANAGSSALTDLFAAGDVRANENWLLTALHTLFLREHNRRCDELVTQHPAWAGQEEMIFQHARRCTVGIMANIWFNEALPLLLGRSLPAYRGYMPGVNPDIALEFSTAGYRVGHTMIPDTLQVGTSAANTVTLVEAFFNPELSQTRGVDAVLQGAALSVMREVDGIVDDALRSQLFGPPSGTQLMDLAALNIQRGRELGLAGYQAIRRAYGLPSVTWDTMPVSAAARTKLQSLYSTPADIDPWLMCILEDHLPGAQVGPLASTIITDQAVRMRNGDRFYFENDPALSAADRANIRATKMADVLNRNTALTFPPDAFKVSA